MKNLSLILILSTLIFSASSRADAADLSKAGTLAGAGRMKEAYRELFSLLREYPDDDEVNLALARVALAADHPHQAVMAYERLIMKYPTSAIFRREIASAYLALGDKTTAEYYLSFDPALDSDSLGAALKEMGKRYERFHMRGSLRLGTFYDSNANQGLDSNRVNLGDWLVELGDSSKKIGTGGLYLGGNIDTSNRLSRVSPWQFVTDGAFYLRYGFSGSLQDEGQEYSQWWRGAVGFRHVGETDIFDFRVKSEVFDYDFDQTVYAFGAEAAFSHAVSRRWLLITRVSVDARNYVRNDAYNGTYGSIGQYAWWLFGTGDHEFTLGGRFIFGDANYKNYSYDGWELSAAFRFKLSDDLIISPSASYVWENYDGPATALEKENREDRRLRLGLSALKRLNERFSLEMSYNYTDNKSNSDIHKYDRHAVSLGCLWNF
ncbi:hypothetical protein AGMMS49957_08110 [Synergistales bacterium]|nr:hypothetical protein AGMMS49957_08110 [Synergistales bacterium]